MKNRSITRRMMLKGVGTIAIGLPFLEEMPAVKAFANPAPVVPVRAFNLFFGLGIPAPLQTEGFAGVLEPLKPLADKRLLLRGVDPVRCDEPGINAHYDGSSGAFTAEPPNGTARAGGPSIDQVIRRAYYADGFPPGVVPTLLAGTFFRRNDRLSRYVQSFNDDGPPAASSSQMPGYQRRFPPARCPARSLIHHKPVGNRRSGAVRGFARRNDSREILIESWLAFLQLRASQRLVASAPDLMPAV